MPPWLEQYALLLIETVITYHSVQSSIIPNILLGTLPLQIFFLFSHTAWQLLLCSFGFFISKWFPLFGFIICSLALSLQFLLPIPSIRRSTLVPIGRRSVTLVDSDRTNAAFDPTDSRLRRINVTLVYPTRDEDVRGLIPAELFDDFSQVGRGLVNVLPAIPNALRWLFRLVLAHVNGPSSAFKDAPFHKTSKFPLVLLLHGITGPRWQYCSLAERIAESGYIVVAPEHPFDSACSVYPDGTRVTYKLGVPPRDNDFDDNWRRWNGYLQERIRDTHGVVLPYLKEALSSYVDWTAGVSVVGHSFGAAEAVELGDRYPETFRRIVCHDLWMYSNARELRTGERVPKVDSLFISSQHWQWPRNLSRMHRFSRASLSQSRLHFNLVLRRARHHNFHDLAVIAPWIGYWLGMLGHGNARELLSAVNETTVAFLERSIGSKTEVNPERGKMTEGRYFECISPIEHVFDDLHTLSFDDE